MVKKTLWQRWTEKAAQPEEFKYYDPLGVRIGNSVTIDKLDYRDLPFFVYEIREYKRPELQDRDTFTDYILIARPINQAEKTIRIRCFNLPNINDGLPYQSVILEQYDQLAHSKDPSSDYQGCLGAVRATTGKFDINVDGKTTEFYRPKKAGGNFQTSGSITKVSVITECLREGAADAFKITTERFELWNYSSTLKDEADQDYEEYLYVELDKDNGWLTIWRGVELDPRHVVLM